MDLDLDAIDESVTHAFFTLSAWNSPDLSFFAHPTVNLEDEAAPDVPLSDFRVENAGNSQAVVMCAALRTAEGGWRVEGLGVLSEGNAKSYGKIQATCTQLIANISR